MTRAALTVLVFAALSACGSEDGALSIEDGLKCASKAFKSHPGAFSQAANRITYSFQSENGPADVVVTFDDRRRPVSTFFENSPYGSHEELMEAARAITDCVAYGLKAGKEIDKGAPGA